MTEPIRYESIQEPLDDEERELMDPDNWDWDNPIKAVIAEDLMVQLPIEVTFEEYAILEQVARAEGMNSHAFIKKTALEAARAKSPELVSSGVSRQTRESRS